MEPAKLGVRFVELANRRARARARRAYLRKLFCNDANRSVSVCSGFRCWLTGCIMDYGPQPTSEGIKTQALVFCYFAKDFTHPPTSPPGFERPLSSGRFSNS